MNISLTPELERFVQNKVESGMYTSASEVIRESLRLLHTHDDLQAQRIKQLNQAIDVGLQQLSSGNKIPWPLKRRPGFVWGCFPWGGL